MGSTSALSAGAYTKTLLVLMVDRVKGGWRAHPPTPGWPDVTIMMECSPESGHCHSVCTLWDTRSLKRRIQQIFMGWVYIS
jgi:hypothetical protein